MSKWVTHPRQFSDNSAGDGPPPVYNRTQAAIQIERSCRGFIGRNKEHRDLLIENNGAFDQWIHIPAGNSAKLSSTVPQVNKLIPLLDGFNAGVLDIHLSAETQIRHENQQAMEAFVATYTHGRVQCIMNCSIPTAQKADDGDVSRYSATMILVRKSLVSKKIKFEKAIEGRATIVYLNASTGPCQSISVLTVIYGIATADSSSKDHSINKQLGQYISRIGDTYAARK
jgi:hypothetical protein